MKPGHVSAPTAEQAAQSAHQQILLMQSQISVLVGIRGAALAQLQDGGYSNEDLGGVLGVTRARAHQLVSRHRARAAAADESG